MRNLKSTDIFALSRIINELGLKEEISKVMQNFDGKQTQEEVGLEVLFAIFEKATTEKGESAIFKFFSNIMEKPEEELKEMDAIEFMNLVFEVADVEKWKDFFTSVAKLMKSK